VRCSPATCSDGEIAIVRQFYISLGASDDEAVDNQRRSLPGSRTPVSPGNPPGEEAKLVGTPEAIARRLTDYVKADVDAVCAIFYAPDKASALHQVELFASDVVPAIGRWQE